MDGMPFGARYAIRGLQIHMHEAHKFHCVSKDFCFFRQLEWPSYGGEMLCLTPTLVSHNRNSKQRSHYEPYLADSPSLHEISHTITLGEISNIIYGEIERDNW